MFSNLIEAAVRLRFMVLCVLVGLGVFAALMIPKLNLDAFPDVTNIQVAINTEAPGLAAEEVEQLITYPIEAVMYALPDVEEVRSISKTGLSGITVVFKEGTDIYFARQLVFERLQVASEMIPDGIGMPEIGPNTSGLGQVYQYLLIAESDSGYDAMALRSLNDYLIKLLLMPVDGITDVLSFGGKVKQYQVNLYPNRLLSYNLTQQDVMDALARNNNNAGGWYLDRGPEQLVIRGAGWLASGAEALTQIKQIPLTTEGSGIVTIGDVAAVELGAEIRQGAVTMSVREENGSVASRGEVVSGVVLKRMGANTNATIEGINARIDLIQQALPKGVHFEPYYDQAALIKQAVNTVVQALLLAFVFIVIVLALFLMSVRATLLVLLSIPVSIGLALSVLSMLGISANLMSLGGIAVAIGMLVDGSVVVVENIYQKLQQREPEHSSISELVVQAAQEVAKPVFFATLIILVVFTPLFSFEGVEAKLFQPMAVAIMLALVCAVVVALIFVPVLSVLVLGLRTPKVRENRALLYIEFKYQNVLSACLNRPKNLLFSIALLLAGSAMVFPQLGTEFAPELEEGTINLRVTLAPSASLTTALDVAPKLEAILLEFPEVTYAVSKIGRAEIGGDPEPVNNIEIYLGLTPVDQWTTASNRLALQTEMEKALEVHPGLLFNFSQPIATRVDELLSGAKAELAIKLFGPDLNALAEYGQQITSAVATISGTRDVAMEQISGEAQLVIRPDRNQLSRYGLDVAGVMNLVQQGLGGQAAGQIIQGNERYDILVRIDSQYRNDIAALAELRLRSAQGAWVRLQDVATIAIESGPPQIRRDDVQRRVVIQANVDGRDMGSVVSDIRDTIDTSVQLPAGYTVQIGGQFENQQRAMQRLMLVVPVSLALIAVLLYFAFGELKLVMLIMVNVPLAAVGGIFSLYVSGHYLSVPSSVGFITLFGVAVLNGVVMVESINQRLANQGVGANTQNAIDVIKDGARSRLRPVLMTALTSALGLLPMLMSNGLGAEIQKPLAAVIVGGLVTCTLLTLVVLPVLYARFVSHTRSQ
ncbi:MAG: efflux RND transporter permease subunit [Aestuariibacter sp.]|uniref:efflux RND transporter permease subunit n=1 Tax=Marisediminitalea aggregata TaxID=634436 RepID=UPI0020CE974F|nr:CusA/CzcA family heavy metal efflux RND transporter [Marisediminitalea aggregata]MCP4529434.1 efflux RND transporter permease subunit [Aestuariibacter sp.]MCP9476837.1 CusA/CzcA family heavy metal efflux RND transporter [Marisediminitalea aggregata]